MPNAAVERDRIMLGEIMLPRSTITGGVEMGLSFDRIADRYDGTRGYPDWVMDDILSALESALEKDSLVLDSGVGTGRFARPLQERGYSVIGIDISNRMLRKALEKGTENIVRGDICGLPFRDQIFRSTLSVHVMHLITKWRSALAEIARVTTTSFVSVAFNKEDSPAEELRRAYDRICGELGFEIRHPGIRERELPDILPPDEAHMITFHEHPVNVEKLLDDYESRTYSSQWSVPDDIHQEAIEMLRATYEGVENILGKERISLLSWDIRSVREFAAGSTRS